MVYDVSLTCPHQVVLVALENDTKNGQKNKELAGAELRISIGILMTNLFAMLQSC